MFCYTEKQVDMLSILITILLISSIYFFSNNNKNLNSEIVSNSQTIQNATNTISQQPRSTKEKQKSSNTISQKQNGVSSTKKMSDVVRQQEEIWEIEIPKIKLQAPIAHGVTSDVMDQYVGHFEDTAIWEGNVGLAAHNRGYAVNYFKDIKLLKKGDEIIYYTTSGVRHYQVEHIAVITEVDWSYLQPTPDNRITLITCLEDEPEHRRCIQAVEIEKERM